MRCLIIGEQGRLPEDQDDPHRGGGGDDRGGLHEPGGLHISEARPVQREEREVLPGEHHREGADQPGGAPQRGAEDLRRLRQGGKALPHNAGPGGPKPEDRGEFGLVWP